MYHILNFKSGFGMKSRLNKVIALILCIVCVFTGISCQKECAHNDVKATEYYKEVDGKVFKTAKCNSCQKTLTVGEEFSVFAVADDANDLVMAQSKPNFIANPVVLLKAGNYQTLQITSYYGATLICEEGVVAEKLIVHEGVSEVLIDGINFSATENTGGVSFGGETADVTIKNCTFTGNAKISNMSGGKNINTVIEKCVMKDLFYGDSVYTAIIIYRYSSLTVKDCVFDGIGYNVLQIGNKDRGGNVLVTGNTFKNVGSRVLYFVNLTGVLSCTVTGNYFYDNTDCVLVDGETDQTGLKKSSGVYIYAGGGTAVDVGVNYWETVPEKDKKFITLNCNYNPVEQLLIDNN